MTVLKTLCSFLLLLPILATNASANPLFIGAGVRQNTTLTAFDSYKIVHHAENASKHLTPEIGRTLNLTMIAEWGPFFTKGRMVEAFEQALQANMTGGEFDSLSSEIGRFKKTLLALPINAGSELQFQHIPGTGLQISMKGPRGFALIFRSADANFSMKIFSIWLGRAHPNANNRENLEQLIKDLWSNAK
jgi:hypothetical protein